LFEQILDFNCVRTRFLNFTFLEQMPVDYFTIFEQMLYTLFRTKVANLSFFKEQILKLDFFEQWGFNELKKSCVETIGNLFRAKSAATKLTFAKAQPGSRGV
jgi:hypothetical protein